VNPLKPTVIAVVGGKKVGKTTTTEKLITELTKRGFKVAAVKHVSETDFTIDTPGKDTWRYAQAGAKTILVLSPNEITTIEKGKNKNIRLKTLLERCKHNDIVFIEGLKNLIATNKTIPKIVVTTSQEQAADALQKYIPILAFSGPYNIKTLKSTIPYADALTNSKKLADTVENILKNRR
jgi:molybdopterin-guanine dinucleotide biosynthesis protein MobB